MNAIPLINNIPKSNINGNEKQLRQEINTSLVALKKEAGTLEGLINEAAQMLVTINNRIATLENDTVKKSDIVDVVQSGNMNPATSNAVADKISSLDVASVGGSGKYISAISETDGKINATATDLGNMVPVDTVTSGNLHSVTSGAVYSELATKISQGTEFGNDNSTSTITLGKGMYMFLLNFHPFVNQTGFYLISIASTPNYNRVFTVDNNNTITLSVSTSSNVLTLTTTTFFRGLLIKVSDSPAV
jgi:hypothetical protein